MTSLVHQEFDVTVVSVYPFGLSVEFDDGRKGLIDNTKDPDWRSGTRGDVVGKVIHVVVLDDDRDPIRLSALNSDFGRAHEARRKGAEIHPVDREYVSRRREYGTF